MEMNTIKCSDLFKDFFDMPGTEDQVPLRQAVSSRKSVFDVLKFPV